MSQPGLTFDLRTLDFDGPLVAIPGFPNRVIRHCAIFINTASGINTPQDLAGKLTGEFGMYGHNAGGVAKKHSFRRLRCKPKQWSLDHWPLNRYMPPFDRILPPHPANVEMSPVPKGKALGDMPKSGEIDALISARSRLLE